MDKTREGEGAATDRPGGRISGFRPPPPPSSLPSGALVVRQGIFGQEKEFLNRREVDAG